MDVWSYKNANKCNWPNVSFDLYFWRAIKKVRPPLAIVAQLCNWFFWIFVIFQNKPGPLETRTKAPARGQPEWVTHYQIVTLSHDRWALYSGVLSLTYLSDSPSVSFCLCCESLDTNVFISSRWSYQSDL